MGSSADELRGWKPSAGRCPKAAALSARASASERLEGNQEMADLLGCAVSTLWRWRKAFRDTADPVPVRRTRAGLPWANTNELLAWHARFLNGGGGGDSAPVGSKDAAE